MKIVNASNLRVERLGKYKYLTWTSVIYILFVPKVIFELDDNGKVKSTNVVGFTKSLLLNFAFIFGIFMIYLFMKGLDLSRTMDFIPFLIGILVFLFLVNFIIVGTTKRIVQKQIE
jgi:hypothetical protein